MVDKIEDVKFGIRKALWNSDKCSYHCNPKDIEIEEDDYFSILRFKLDVN